MATTTFECKDVVRMNLAAGNDGLISFANPIYDFEAVNFGDGTAYLRWDGGMANDSSTNTEKLLATMSTEVRNINPIYEISTFAYGNDTEVQIKPFQLRR